MRPRPITCYSDVARVKCARMPPSNRSDAVWLAWIAAFIILESRIRGMEQLSPTMRRWLGIEPRARRRVPMCGMYIAGLIWLGKHIIIAPVEDVTSCGSPDSTVI
jgi:hypothetical protein